MLGLPLWSSGPWWVSRLLLLPTDPVATASSDILFLFGFSCGVEYELLTHAHIHHYKDRDTALFSLFNLGLRTPGRPWTSLSLETGKAEPTPLPRAASQTSPQDFSHMPQFLAEHLKVRLAMGWTIHAAEGTPPSLQTFILGSQLFLWPVWHLLPPGHPPSSCPLCACCVSGQVGGPCPQASH